MLSPQGLVKSPMFEGIAYEDYQQMLDCFQAVQKTYQPEELMYDFASGDDKVGVIERGGALLMRIDAEGVETVLEDLDVGSVFGRSLAFAGSSGDSLEVISRTRCDVLYINYSQILKRCERACTHHSVLVQNMLRLISGKAQALTERVDVLSRRSIRDKLLCYFRQQADKAGSSRFTLPFSLSTLAEYIATDRSAMMRELRRLREEGLFQMEGREVTLL